MCVPPLLKILPNQIPVSRLLAISMNMTMEGTESVGDTISGLLYQASRRPAEQRKVQRELDSVLGREVLPSWLDRKKLPYLEAFIQELYRTAQAFSITTHYCNFGKIWWIVHCLLKHYVFR